MSNSANSYALAAKSEKRVILDKFLENTSNQIERLVDEIEAKLESASELAPNDALQKESGWRLREIRDLSVGIRTYNREL